ncbi:MAG: Hsp20/alpha crystallin family protein [Rhodoferax sp.]|nr:Hsp20/alpha crystallin family protein [Rhodoferax sp.]
MANLRLFEPSLNEPFESVFRRFMSPLRLEKNLDDMDIRVDVVEKDAGFTVRADLPGVKKEDINVRIDGNLVQIDAETKSEKELKEDGGKVLRCERYYGAVSRAFTLTQDVDEAKAVAKYENGVLTLELPKKTTSSAKRLAIS